MTARPWSCISTASCDEKLSVGAFRRRSPTRFTHVYRASALNSTGVAAGFFQGHVRRGAGLERRAYGCPGTRWNKNDQLTSGTGLIGRWGLDEGSGTTAADSVATPTALNGTLVSTPTWVAGYTFPPDSTAPANPQNLVATAGDTQVALSWNANAEPDLAGYNVYRSLLAGVPTAGTPAQRHRPRHQHELHRHGPPQRHHVLLRRRRSRRLQQRIHPLHRGNRDPRRACRSGHGRRRRHRRLHDGRRTPTRLPWSLTSRDTCSQSETTRIRTGRPPNSRTATTRPGALSRTARARPWATTTSATERPPALPRYFDYFNGVGNPNGPAGDRDSGLLQL